MTLRIPGATYRLQLHSGFEFSDAEGLLDYLDDLGITDLYVSPILTARKGSQHGYDVVDPEHINPELGGEEGLLQLAEALHQRGMGLLVDIVPNHMCVGDGASNRFWYDILENGRSSIFAHYFDIDWSPPKSELVGKVLLPILGDQYGEVLERQELSVKLEQGAFSLHYYEHVLPLDPKSWLPILERGLELVRKPGDEEAGPDKGSVLLESILTGLGYLPGRDETDPERQRERNREKEVLKARLGALFEEDEETRAAINTALEELNGRPGDEHSFDALDRLLDDQAYRLAHWRVATDEVNYRRFFDINELASVRVEEPDVFLSVHSAVLKLVETGRITGFRVDHVDGLFDPTGYLRSLQRLTPADGLPEGAEMTEVRVPSHVVVEPDFYVVVEKILAEKERLPSEWPIHGTTGYDFLNLAGGVMVDRAGARRVEELYGDFVGGRRRFEDIVYQCKKLILRHAMASQVAMLARRLDRISEQHRKSRDFTLQSLQEALVEVLARFSVYRTYIRPDGTVTDNDEQWIEEAVAAAQGNLPAVSSSLFDFLRDVLLGRHPPGLDGKQIRQRRSFVLRLQQLTGAVMAKSVEDTAFYRYFPLASRGEVGGTPDQPGVTVEEFHQANLERLRTFPHSLLASTTHDTKRSEDVRSRIRVLSEAPRAWEEVLVAFSEMNAKYKQVLKGRIAPSANEEYLLYQTLVGMWPAQEPGEAERELLIERLGAYMEKALREAKVNTSWVNPNLAWEGSVRTFVRQILQAEAGFTQALEEFLRPSVPAARYSALSQLVLKMVSPGVPDTYQGNELWDSSLVDPDNRRPVDYQLRRRLLKDLEHAEREQPKGLLRELAENPEDGRIKLFVTSRSLKCRRRHPSLFARGSYVPLYAEGSKAANIIACARVEGERAVVAVAARGLLSLGGAPATGHSWGSTSLRLHESVPPGLYRDIFSRNEFHIDGHRELRLAEVFAEIPVAILESQP